MVDYSQIKVNREGFATIKTPVSASSMMRHALDIDATFNDILNGTGRKATINRLLFTGATAKTISGGIVSTPTQVLHTITSQSGTSDDLDTIGSYDNTFLALRATAGHAITVRNGAGNITIPGGVNVVLSGNITIYLWCADGQWSTMGVTRPPNNFSATADPSSSNDNSAGYSIGSLWVNTTLDRAWICVDSTVGAAIWRLISPYRNSFKWRVGSVPSTINLGIGVAALSESGSGGSVSTDNGYFRNLGSAASAGSVAGFVSASFNLARLDHNIIAEFFILSDAIAMTSVRHWIGLTSADVTDVDTLAVGTKFVGFRFSSVAGDSAWKPVLNNGTSQTNGTAIGSIAVNTAYKLRIRVDSANARAYFSVDDSAEQLLSSNMPAITTEVGFVYKAIAQASSIRDANLNYAEVGW